MNAGCNDAGMKRPLEGRWPWELFAKVTLLVLALVVTGVVFWNLGHESHGQVPDRLADLIGDDGCENVAEEDRDPGTLRDYHARYSRVAANTATQLVAVYCPELGPSTLYTGFETHAAAIRATRTSRMRLCVLPRGFFDNALEPGQFGEYCERLGGHIREVQADRRPVDQ